MNALIKRLNELGVLNFGNLNIRDTFYFKKVKFIKTSLTLMKSMQDEFIPTYYNAVFASGPLIGRPIHFESREIVKL